MDNRQTRSLQRRLLGLAAIGTLTTSLVVAVIVGAPLYQTNKSLHQQSLMAAAENQAAAIREHLNMLGYIAMQIADRTFAREKLELFQRHQISLEALRSATQPVMNDAMARMPQIAGITRLGRDNTPLISVGEAISAEFWPIPIDDIHPRHLIGTPLELNGKTRILVGVRIFDRQQQRIGTDVIAFDSERLLTLQAQHQHLTPGETLVLGILDNGAIRHVILDHQATPSPTLEQALLQAAQGASGITIAKQSNGEEVIAAYTQVGDYPWGLVISSETKALFAPLRQELISTALTVAALIGAAMLLIVQLLRPLSGQILIRTDELEQEIQEKAANLRRSNRALQALSACGNALIHASDEKTLLQEICSIVVGVGGYRLAWIGYVEHDAAKSVTPVAQAGFEEGYLETAKLSWAEENERGRGPGGTAIRSGNPCVIRDAGRDTRFQPWREEALKRGFASVIGLPLLHADECFGVLMIYSSEYDAFDEEEIRLLTKLGNDLAYGIMSLRTHTEQHWTEQELIDSEERWRSLTDNSPDHIMTLTPDLRIEFANYASPGLSVEELIGTPLLSYIDDVGKRQEVEQKLKVTLASGIPCSYETEYKTPDGERICYESRVSPRFIDDKVVGLTLIARDISKRKQDEARIQHLAYHDELTGLPNRRLLMDRLEQNISVTRRHHTKGALLFLDLDRFKTINDSLGHAAGDTVLREVARRLSQQVRAEDSVARLGGDEFMVLLPELKERPKEAGYEAGIVAEKLRQALSQPYDIDGNQYHLSPSIGIAIFPIGHETAEDVLKHADTAMYRAKAAGRDAVRFYHPSMQEAADQRLALEKDLRAALEKEEFELHYQPLINSAGEAVGAEALLRWRHPQRGLVPPENFIAVAEETGLILPLGDWVLSKALEQLYDWLRNNHCNQSGCLAVNVSPRQFHQPDFVDRVTRVLQQKKVAPSFLKLEITESLMIEDIEDTVAKMEALRRLGVRIAIDDFGTGYSSLAYLKRLPIDQIKIDKSFVTDMSSDGDDAAIVETIIAIARHLKLEVVAEGVETSETLDLLKANGCRIFQGFYFSHPLPAAEFEHYLSKHRLAPVRA